MHATPLDGSRLSIRLLMGCRLLYQGPSVTLTSNRGPSTAQNIPCDCEHAAAAATAAHTLGARSLSRMAAVCKHMECHDIVLSVWGTRGNIGSLVDVNRKIEDCGRLLDSWNAKRRMQHKQDISNKRKALKEASRTDVPKTWNKIRILENQLDEALYVEERYWCQRAKINWIKSGDRNFRFFHAKASVHKAGNRMMGLLDPNGAWCESKEEMEDIISTYFTDLFTSGKPKKEDIEKVTEGVTMKLSDPMVRFL
ncbi:hypothetical protein Dsin_005322 [Dipteronia sinensis]|uniref:Uncharacterized protein n=1 Tax=Dipteronia sinensis TaxID=43782 RepID=A0AAE0EGE0_9ROSI|nr:hypothetical protein Dsin_005322 [Dipteronia sinensis]